MERMVITVTAKGMTNMNLPKHIKKFISSVVCNYATYNKLDGFYIVDLVKLPESELEEFSSLIMNHDHTWACEATGLDNPAYEDSMLPSLNLYLSNPYDKDNEIKYLQSWRDGVSSYFKITFTECILNELEDFNREHGVWAA